jgi:hypothetical protein
VTAWARTNGVRALDWKSSTPGESAGCWFFGMGRDPGDEPRRVAEREADGGGPHERRAGARLANEAAQFFVTLLEGGNGVGSNASA